MPTFLPGLELSRRFFAEAVRPVLAARCPGLRYAAGLLGSGSEVLGFDTPMSADHGWGPRVDLFFAENDGAAVRDRVDGALRRELPNEFLGYPTGFTAPDPADGGTRRPDPRGGGPVEHLVGLYTVRGFFREYLAYDVGPDDVGPDDVGPDDPQPEIAPADWLTFPEQKLRTLAAGAVFHDDVGLDAVRRRFAYYPHDVWLYLLAAGWARVGQEEHLMGRAGVVGDELGSALIAARLVRDLMRLGFLRERTYAPYAKWFGTAFGRLRCAAALAPHLAGALATRTWQAREAHLVPAYEIVAAMHNALGVTEPLPTTARAFFGRPFRVIALHGFADALLARVGDARVRRLARRPPIGGVDQFSDSTDLVGHVEWRPALRALYE